MKHQVYFGIAFRIILLFGVSMLFTFITPELRDFFGDTKCVPEYHSWGVDDECGGVDTDWEWGARHYWYFNMVVVLFLLSLINTVLSIASLLKKNYPNEFKP